MPKTLIFAPCSAAIVDVFTNGLSIVQVMENLSPIAQAEDEEDNSRRLVIPPYNVITLWWREEGDEADTFEQRLVLFAPDGEESVFSPVQSFQMTHPFHRVRTQTPFIGARTQGTYWLHLQIRKSGTEEWAEVASFPSILSGVDMLETVEREGKRKTKVKPGAARSRSQQ